MGKSLKGWTVSRLRQFIRDTTRNYLYLAEQAVAPIFVMAPKKLFYTLKIALVPQSFFIRIVPEQRSASAGAI